MYKHFVPRSQLLAHTAHTRHSQIHWKWRDYFYRSMNIGHNLIHTQHTHRQFAVGRSCSRCYCLAIFFLYIITSFHTTSNEINGFAWNANIKSKHDLYLFSIELHIERFHCKAGSAQALEVTNWQIIIIQVISKRSSRRKFIVVARAAYNIQSHSSCSVKEEWKL